MMHQFGSGLVLFAMTCVFAGRGVTQDPVLRLAFDGSAEGEGSYVRGLEGQALRLTTSLTCAADELRMDVASDFSVQFWVRTTAGSDQRMILLSKKEFASNSLHSQKRPGWVFCLSHGTWAWNMGSGKRRITYERDNGHHMPLNDGRWHQLTMTHDSARAEVRLYFDGVERAIYNLGDSDGFDFTNDKPLIAGGGAVGRPQSPPTIGDGASNLRALVEEFNGLGLGKLQDSEFIDLIVDPRRFCGRKAREQGKSMEQIDLTALRRAESALMKSPYTVHQSRSFMEVAPLAQIYALIDGKVSINEEGARAVTASERLDAPDFDIDNLAVWDRALSHSDVLSSYSRFFEPVAPGLQEKVRNLTAACWNIEHGGKHFTIADDGWDSRVTIAEMIRRAGADVVMLQETYSSGDFIAAELGFHFAAGVDWDYLNQGANISVLSRFPIEEVHVPPGATFSNVGVKVSLSQTQSMYVMSNWYGMNKFPEVFDYHADRFAESDGAPTLFAGDFNAVPHTEGGRSPASQKMLGAGFVDAFRSLYPDVEKHPGYSHRSERRIDQLYYKGAGLTNTSTRVVSTWPTGFPSDHYLILASFALK